MPQTMCCDPICTVAEIWCCSEHYLWLFVGSSLVEAYTAIYCYCAVISEIRLLKLLKLVVCKLDLLRGGFTRCHGVLGHGLNSQRNIPLSCYLDILVQAGETSQWQ